MAWLFTFLARKSLFLSILVIGIYYSTSLYKNWHTISIIITLRCWTWKPKYLFAKVHSIQRTTIFSMMRPLRTVFHTWKKEIPVYTLDNSWQTTRRNMRELWRQWDREQGKMNFLKFNLKASIAKATNETIIHRNKNIHPISNTRLLFSTISKSTLPSLLEWSWTFRTSNLTGIQLL